MDPHKAIELLEGLKAELRADGELNDPSDTLSAWIQRLKTIVSRALGSDSDLLERIGHVHFSPMIMFSGQPQSAYDEAARSGVVTVKSYIDNAIWELGLMSGGGVPAVTTTSDDWDPALWNHVKGLVETNDWAHLPAAVAIFTENWVRVWSDLPATLVGHALYVKALADDGPLALGTTGGEAQGWRALGMGLAQAVGNVDRHRIQNRSDLRSYAMGVLGLGSLLLTQLRMQYPEKTGATPS